jgi:hypothetical protein
MVSETRISVQKGKRRSTKIEYFNEWGELIHSNNGIERGREGARERGSEGARERGREKEREREREKERERERDK